MRDDRFAVHEQKADWLHKTPAIRLSVAWVYVYVFTPQTVRTVVRIPVATYGHPAMVTNKIFYGACKAFLGECGHCLWSGQGCV